MKVAMNKEMEEYFQEIESRLMVAYNVAGSARKKGYDPNDYVEMPLARNMAERVCGLISAVAPQIEKEAVVNRIFELEKQYGMLNWRVALQIAEDVAREKFCKFKDEKEAMEIGIRTGIAYITVGIVASPLEGFVELKIKKRKDGKKYFSLYFSGPIRSAGGTGAAVSVLIADYIRKQFGYSEYDPMELEIKRYVTEIYDYHERITNLQYLPSEEELEFLTSHLPVQINGDPSERIEVSNYKSLDRVETNRLRNGVCLVIAEGLAQKAPKLVKQLEVWGKDFGLEHWEFLSKFVRLQKKIRAKEEIKEEFKIMPDYNYIKDLVAGRPVLTYPLRKGGFRLRYGRSRLSGLSSMSMHPATMILLEGYIGIGTQLKYERPGKSSAMASCDSIEGPIVKLNDDSVIIVDSVEEAKKYANDVVEILYLGDFLVNYGEFFNRAHKLVPVGYCEEWYKQEIKKALMDYNGDKKKIIDLIKDVKNIDIKNALEISRVLNVPLHPRYTYHWRDLTKKQFLGLFNSIIKFNVERIDNDVSKMTLPLYYEKTDIELEDPKRVLELLGVPHKIVEKNIVIENGYAYALAVSLGVSKKDYDDRELKKIRDEIEKYDDMMEIINLISEVRLRDKGGTYIGARMGRPEKAKMRKLIGSPNVLFPVGKEGGRLRSFQSSLEKGKITAEFPIYYCSNCGKESIYKICEYCNSRNKTRYFCRGCNKDIDYEECEKHGIAYNYRSQCINIKEYFKMAIKKLGNRSLPELVKGVRGTSNKRHVPEHLSKAILRACYDLYVNKDGTIRYDMTEMPITTFKAKEIGTNLEKLKELGYEKDIYGNKINNEDQLIELRVQDIILPSCVGAMEDGADNVLIRVAKFVDDLLVSLYNEKPFYSVESRDDLIGHLVIGLAPHTSAAIAGRIIGFSKTQGCFAHPYWHAAMRRDCEGDENCVMLLMDALLNFSRDYLPMHRGATQDAPLVLTSMLIPSEVDDMVFDMDVVNEYPLELYEAALEYKNPWDIKIEQIKDRLNTENQYNSFGFTHDTDDMNNGILVSAYKLLPSMREKVKGQMKIAEKIRAVDENDVARLIIDRHFMRDIRGNLRKFSTQQFRCVGCNEKYRRPPLVGKCTTCGGKIIFTVSEGFVTKYLGPSLELAEKYNLPTYLRHTLELTKRRIEGVFGRDKEKQEGLGRWF